MSVAILVHELQNEPFNPILFYKPQEVNRKRSLLSKKQQLSFGLQTEFQMELDQKFSYKIYAHIKIFCHTHYCFLPPSIVALSA